MEAELGKYEPVFREVIDAQGNKARVRSLKLSLYLDVHEFPDVTSFDGAKLYLYREKPEQMQQGTVAIDPELRQRLLDVFKAGVGLLEEEK